jgi:two-component system, LytTR family, response regulator
MISVLIADDEGLARDLLIHQLNTTPSVRLVAACTDGQGAWEAMETHRPDVLLLDIQMPELNGLELAQRLQAVEGYQPVIVFVTAYDDYALRAFEANAVDYLLKPFDAERFGRIMQKAIQQVHWRRQGNHLRQDLDWLRALLPTNYPDIVTVKDGGRIQLVRLATLTHVEADGNYVALHTDKSKYLLLETLTAFEQKLNPKQFVRIHRSTIVNLTWVREIQSHFNGDYTVLLTNGPKLRLSRTYKDKLLSVLG